MQYSKLRLRQKSLLFSNVNTRSTKNFMLEAEEQGEQNRNLQFLAQSKAFFFIYHAHSDQSEVIRSGREYLSSLVVKQTGGSAKQPEHIWKCHGQVLMKCLIPVAQLKKACVFHIKCFPTITCLYVSFPLCSRKLSYIKVLKIGKCPGPVFLTSAVLFPSASKVRFLQPGRSLSPLRRDQRRGARVKTSQTVNLYA